MGTPDHSPVRPGWPLRPHEDDEHAPARKRRAPRPARVAWSVAGACAALAAFALGMARWRAAAAPSATPEPTATVMAAAPPKAPVATPPVIEASAPPSAAPAVDASTAPILEETADLEPSPTDLPTPRPAPRPVVVVSSAPFWTIPRPTPPATTSGGAAAGAPGTLPPTAAVAPTPIPPTPLPSRILNGRWTGFLTDSFCREKGAVSDHGQCLETCLRRGRQPMMLVDGQLYRVVNFERIRGQHDKAVTVEGQLDVERGVLIVTSGAPGASR